MDGKICIKVEPRGQTNSIDKLWDDGLVGRIKQILVWYDEDFFSGFQTIYECTTGKRLTSKRHGGNHGNFEMHNLSTINEEIAKYPAQTTNKTPQTTTTHLINPKKPLTWLSGYYETVRVDPELFPTDEETEEPIWNFYKRITSLKFGNEEETYGPFGSVKGTPFLFRGSTEIVGFHGCSNEGSYGHISAMGVYFKTEAVGVIGQPSNPEESVEVIEEKKPKSVSGVLLP
ncbi:hypothetical protein MA16_Dca007230 [Dendrobium catenatum]|uniref:Jacalin-type lectin domain-containing protein n=1 Tax=Dendrobium catenatum TaxID=906689 RepID=A0A2I0W6F0_9ASPA|nr:hypothetical protein MA16_Dca007230 [Dendrobium catenatum]